MDINDLDEDEFTHLVQWLTANLPDAGVVDLRVAPAWKFAQARAAVEVGGNTQFPEINGSSFPLP
jgi:hypothetical protein